MIRRSLIGLLLLQPFLWSLWVPEIEGWVSTNVSSRQRRTPKHKLLAIRKRPPVVDAEFERVQPEPDPQAAVPTTGISSNSRSKSLIDLSLEADSDFNTRVPFVDKDGERYIDVKLAFMVECDGVNYGIGVPFDQSAAITAQGDDGSILYVSPDDDDNEEVMQIFAAQLQTQIGENLHLKRTPRVLTISGPLENYTSNWMEEILPKPVGIEELLDDSDVDLSFFHKFMQEELGQEAYQSVMDDHSDDISEEITRLFDIPGLGTQADDLQGMKDLVDSIMDDPEAQTKPLSDIGENLDHDGVALKLVSYLFPGGKEYSLVKLLKPYVLTARVQVDEDGMRFDLLTRDEENIVAPRIEALCRVDLERLSGSSLIP